MGSHTEETKAHREQGIGDRRGSGSKGIEQGAGKQEYDDDGYHVDEQKPKVHTRCRLTEEDHEPGIRDVRAGELHVVGGEIGRHPVEQELAGIGELPLIAFKGELEQAPANEDCQHDRQQQGCDW